MDLPWGLTSTSVHVSISGADETSKICRSPEEPTEVDSPSGLKATSSKISIGEDPAVSKRKANRRKKTRRRSQRSFVGASMQSCNAPKKMLRKSPPRRCVSKDSWADLEFDDIMNSDHDCEEASIAPPPPPPSHCRRPSNSSWGCLGLDELDACSHHSEGSWAGLDILAAMEVPSDEDHRHPLLDGEESQVEFDFDESLLLDLNKLKEMEGRVKERLQSGWAAEVNCDSDSEDEDEEENVQRPSSVYWPDFNLDDLSESETTEPYSDDDDYDSSDDENE